MARMGVLGRLVGEIALNMTVDESARGPKTFSKLVGTGNALRERGAGAVILADLRARHGIEILSEQERYIEHPLVWSGEY